MGWSDYIAPPDVAGAVGGLVMTMQNFGVHVQTRGGISVQETTNGLKEFGTGTNLVTYDTVFDPRMAYDPAPPKYDKGGSSLPAHLRPFRPLAANFLLIPHRVAL